MQASSLVSYTSENSFNLIDCPVMDRKASSEGIQPGSEDNAEKPAAAKNDIKDQKNDADASKMEPHATDPLVWFGVLAPLTLRHSQSAFKSALDKIAKLASVDSEMKAMEIEIRRSRKKMKMAVK